MCVHLAQFHIRGMWRLWRDYRAGAPPLAGPPIILGPLQRPQPHLRVLTLNVGGIPIMHSCEHRCRQLIAYIRRGPAYDMIALQEVWHARERQLWVEYAQAEGMHHHHFEQGCGFPGWPGQTGTGMLLLSRYPIVRAQYQHYSVITSRRSADK